jgi:hypothetical protein
MEQVEITINADGSSTISVNGVQGSGCKNLTAVFTGGSEITEEKTTNEYYQQPQQQQQSTRR